MVISLCGLHGLLVLMLVEEPHYGHVNVTVLTQRLQMAGKTARDRAFNLNCARSIHVQVSRPIIKCAVVEIAFLGILKEIQIIFSR